MSDLTRQYTQNFTDDPDSTNIYEALTNDDLEIKRILKLWSSLGALNLSGTKRQSVLYGPTDSSGNPNYLTTSGLQVSIDGASKTIYLAFANGFNDSGSVDLVDKISSLISNAYTLPANQTCYLYVDKDINTGLLSYGYSLLPDLYQKSAPASPTLDQHYFNTAEMKMYRWNGSAREAKQRVFIAKAVTDASTTTLTIYPFGSRAPIISNPIKVNGISFDASTDVDLITSIQSFKNLKVQVTSNTAATITADTIALLNAANQTKVLSNINLTLATGTVGANGLDTGALAASSWYYLYAIHNPTTNTTACLMSLSATTPTLPSGYTYFARIGAIRCDASKYLMRTLQYGRKVQYVVTPSTNTANFPLMASGTSSSYSAISVSNFVPPTASEIKLITLAPTAGNQISLAANTNSAAGSSTANPAPIWVANGNGNFIYPVSLLLESSNLYWWTYGAGGYVYCVGWEDNL